MRTPISVVIPTYNGLPLLKKHLPQVMDILQKGDEIIIVDDAGNDQTPEWCKTVSTPKISVQCIRHTTNKRFAAAVNSGVRAAKNEFVFLLNNDVSPLVKSSVDYLLQWFSDPHMFAVGCAEITEKKENSQVFGRGTGDWRRGLAVHWYDPNQSLTNTLWTSGGSMFFDRQKFLSLGGFDTLYAPAYEEDRDLSYRALKHGFEIAFDPRVMVLHQHESTNTSVLGKRKMDDTSWKNQYLFVWKNISDPFMLASHILWLPYHLTVSGYRSSWSSIRGFFLALKQFPEAMRQRKTVSKLWKRQDREVFHLAAMPQESPFSQTL